MPLSLAAFAPHSPLLLPTLGKNGRVSLAPTIEAYRQLAADLADKKIQTVIIISPLGIIQPNVYTLNVQENFTGNFELFGDLATKFEVRGNPALAHRLQIALTDKYHLQLTSANPLDYGSALPLFFIRQQSPKIKVLPLYPADTDLPNLFAFGRDLRQTLDLWPKKTAIIASGCLSQRLSQLSPAGYSPKARGWDKSIIKALQANQPAIILEQDKKIRAEVKELGLGALAVVLGALDKINKTPQQLAYQASLGIGLLLFESWL
jgi:aromatic ring-opening dioxygenase LigB subunit